jgi:signal transduction histidine kinase
MHLKDDDQDLRLPSNAHGMWLRVILRPRTAIVRYLAAVLLCLVSLLLVELSQWLDGEPLTSFAVLSVVFSALYGGLGPAVLDTMISALAVDYFYAEPKYQLFDSAGSLFSIAIYLIIGTVIAGITAALKSSYQALFRENRATERAKKLREETLSIVSHDLRTPLSAVLFSAVVIEEMLKAGQPASEAAKALGALVRSAKRMNRIIDDLLDYARMEAGTFRIEPARFPLETVIAESVDSMKAAAEGRGIRLTLNHSDNGVLVSCDKDRIIQVLENLIGTAIKFSPEGGSVTVESKASGNCATLAIQDEGPGIPSDQLPRIFERHWQARRTAHQGTGLGLFIAKSIVEAHGGRIEVQSTVGMGTRFTVSLPTKTESTERLSLSEGSRRRP